MAQLAAVAIPLSMCRFTSSHRVVLVCICSCSLTAGLVYRRCCCCLSPPPPSPRPLPHPPSVAAGDVDSALSFLPSSRPRQVLFTAMGLSTLTACRVSSLAHHVDRMRVPSPTRMWAAATLFFNRPLLEPKGAWMLGAFSR